MNTSDILDKAADDIQRWGWARADGWFAEAGQPACIEGALKRVCGSYGESTLAREALKLHLGLGTFPVFCWNDQPLRTQAEVIEVLRATAVIEAARETQPTEVPA